jgi:hypothetical protein
MEDGKRFIERPINKTTLVHCLKPPIPMTSSRWHLGGEGEKGYIGCSKASRTELDGEDIYTGNLNSVPTFF